MTSTSTAGLSKNATALKQPKDMSNGSAAQWIAQSKDKELPQISIFLWDGFITIMQYCCKYSLFL